MKGKRRRGGKKTPTNPKSACVEGENFLAQFGTNLLPTLLSGGLFSMVMPLAPCLTAAILFSLLLLKHTLGKLSEPSSQECSHLGQNLIARWSQTEIEWDLSEAQRE